MLDASTATAEQLAALPGMTPDLAEAIVAGQPYASVTAFNPVLMQSLSAEQAAQVRERLFALFASKPLQAVQGLLSCC